MVETIDRAVFLGGSELSKREEKKIHDLVKDRIEKYINIEEDIYPIISSGPIPAQYLVANSPITAIERLSLGNSDEELSGEGGIHISSVGKKNYDSLVQNNMLEYFVRSGRKVKISTESFTEAEKLFAKTQKQLDTAKSLVQAAFGAALFFGIRNLFGMANDILGDAGLPYFPDVIIGTIPFYSAQKLERGMSDRALKYRAIGDIFLAHQRGSTDTLRIDLTLFGPYRSWYLLYLLSLEQSGESRLKELELLETGIKAPVNPLPGEEVRIPKKGKVQYETHTTFPIITNTAYTLDMFLQTIEWHQEKDKGGHDVIYVHLLFRKHVDPKGYVVFDKNDKTGYTHYGQTLSERRRREYMLDTMWKCAKIGSEVLTVGLFGGKDMVTLDKEAISSDPYVTDISKLIGGYSFDINNMASIIPGLGV